MKTQEEIKAISEQFYAAQGDKAEVFDVMYENFELLLDIAEGAVGLRAKADMLDEAIDLLNFFNVAIRVNMKPLASQHREASELVAKAKELGK